MATITSTPTGGNLTVNGTTQVSGTISWSKPTIPSGATISSCVLTGTATASMSKGSATITVNGTTVTSGTPFTINLGTANNTTSVTTTAKGGNKQSKGTVSFSNLVYTVTYEEAAAPKPTYTVTFKDWDGTTLKTQTVEEGASATAPSNPSRDGYNFTGWDNSFTNIIANITVTAQYSIKTYTVIFKDDDGSTLKTQTVNHGSNATAPSNPSKEGYTFTGWDKSFTNITSDLTVTAQYTKNEEPEPEIPEGTPVEKTIALRPISATQDSGYNNTWTNIANTYDTDTSTSGTIIVTGSSQSGFKRKYVDTIFNFDNPIPANATINSAVLTIRAKQSATTNLNITASIGSQEVISSTLLSSSSANYTADVANYVKDLNQLNINLTSAATSNRTFTLYDVRVDVNYTTYEMPNPTYTVTFKDWDGTTLKTETVEEGASATAPSNPSRVGYNFTGWDKDFTNITSDLTVTAQYTKNEEPEEPEEEIIEWTGLGTVATNLSTEDDWTYKLNIDWDTQYVEINNIVAHIAAFRSGANVLYLNNEYDLSTGDLICCDETGMVIIDSSSNDYGIDFYSDEFSIKISKDNGFTFYDNYSGESFTIENYLLIEDSSTLYLSSLVHKESGNSTIGEIKVVALDEPEKNESLKLGGNTIDALYIGGYRIIQMYLNGQQLL